MALTKKALQTAIDTLVAANQQSEKQISLIADHLRSNRDADDAQTPDVYKTAHEIRLENVQDLIRSCGSLKQFAEAIDREPTYVSRIAGARPTKSIGFAMARHIEASLNLIHGQLDHESNIRQARIR